VFLGRKKDPAETAGSGKERRRWPRMTLRSLVRVRLRKRGQLHCHLRNLSLGGLAFSAPFRVDLNEPVSFEIDPPEGAGVGGHRVEIDGTVVSSTKSARADGTFIMGCRFGPLDEDSRRTILAWFESFGEEAEFGAGPPRPRGRRGGQGTA